MNQPRVGPASGISVVIPFRNAVGTIGRTLEALEASNLRPLEVICVDDRSTDASSAQVLAFAACTALEVRRIAAPEGRPGAAAARNAGAAAAAGDRLLFLDADVVVEPETLERLARRFLTGSYAAVLALPRETSLRTGLLAHFQAHTLHGLYDRLDPRDSPCLGAHCILLPTESFRILGGFSEAYAGATVEDFAFGYRLRAGGGRIGIARDARVSHNHNYNLFGFIKNYFGKARELACLLLEDRSLSLAETGYHQPSNLLALSLAVAPLLIAPLAGRFGPLAPLALGLLPLALAFAWRLYAADVARRRGWGVAAAFVGLRALVTLLGGLGAAVAVLSRFARPPAAGPGRRRLAARLLELIAGRSAGGPGAPARGGTPAPVTPPGRGRALGPATGPAPPPDPS